MSFSRSGKNLTKLLTNQTKPSPTYQTCDADFAQNPIHSVNCGIFHTFISNHSGERISLFTFFLAKITAGMTVEATILLPIFMFFMLNMGSALEMIRLHGNLQLSLWDVGRKVALYSYGAEVVELLEDRETANLVQRLAEKAFAGTYVKAKTAEQAGEKYLDESPIVGGSDGLFMMESDIFTEDDCVELYMTYSVKPFGGLPGNVNFRMANKYYAHLWNGYEIPGTVDTEQAVAYLAENAAVYHLDRKCTHLLLSVKCIFTDEIAQARNSYGERYEECKKCVVPAGDLYKQVCYIAEDGECYHWDVDCSGLKRTVRKVTMEEAMAYAPCSRCAAK